MLEFELTKPSETFHFNPPVEGNEDWMLGLTSLEVSISVFNITEENNKFALFTDLSDSDFSFSELKDKVAEVLSLSDSTIEDLEHEIYEPSNIKTYRKLSTEKSQTHGYYIILLIYMQSSFRDFESYLRILGSLDENDIRLILKHYNSKLTTHRIPPGAYNFKDLSEVLSRGFENEFAIRGRIRPNH